MRPFASTLPVKLPEKPLMGPFQPLKFEKEKVSITAAEAAVARPAKAKNADEPKTIRRFDMSAPIYFNALTRVAFPNKALHEKEHFDLAGSTSAIVAITSRFVALGLQKGVTCPQIERGSKPTECRKAFPPSNFIRRASACASDDSGDLAKQLANLIGVPRQSNLDYRGGAQSSGSQYTLNIQPVIAGALRSPGSPRGPSASSR